MLEHPRRPVFPCRTVWTAKHPTTKKSLWPTLTKGICSARVLHIREGLVQVPACLSASSSGVSRPLG
jgi:hypothetical protein